MTKTARETFFNRFEPFYKSMVVYVAAGVLAVLSWIFAPTLLGRTALTLGCVAFAIQTIGLVFRIYLQNYPPVTNLYSAAVVVGWGAAGIGLLVEHWFRNAIGTAVAAVVGFCTLLVAHHLSLGGDTMEMMQAVLDSNFWLSVHVPTIVLGYSAAYAAGAAGVFYLVLRAISIATGPVARVFTPQFGQTLYKIAYGIVCFATLLSFVGTVLGGIWADQSWGRFWGWDPKENGAALIVIWCAVILHARWAGLVRERGMMVMAIFGNIITTWSFFGTNMLGVGLHSYGFTSEGFYWMVGFMVSQVAIMLLAVVPGAFGVSLHRTSTPLPAASGAVVGK
jgi:ABC-type transport system involved in cytochrome c biogenesis permease subunit